MVVAFLQKENIKKQKKNERMSNKICISLMLPRDWGKRRKFSEFKNKIHE